MIYTEQIQAVLQKEGKSQPTLIQKETYEAIKNGASLVALAKTGTGKTLAYALPALERVIPGEKNSLVILAPTTELAVQIRNAILPFAKALGLKTLALVGAGNRQRQDERLKKDNCEVLVCTPGRFFDFFSSGRIKLVQIKTLVIDEADDILEFAKLELLSSLGQNLPSSSQILLFGATESQITQEAEEIFARHFLLVDVRPDQGSQTEHVFLQVDNEHIFGYEKHGGGECVRCFANFSEHPQFMTLPAGIAPETKTFSTRPDKGPVLVNQQMKLAPYQFVCLFEKG